MNTPSLFTKLPLLALLAASITPIAGWAEPESSRPNARYHEREFTKESHPLRLMPGVSPEHIAKLGLVGVYTPLFVAEADPNSQIRFGDYVFENTAAVIMTKKTEVLPSASMSNPKLKPAPVTFLVPLGVVSTGMFGDPETAELRMRPLYGAGDVSHIALPLSPPSLNLPNLPGHTGRPPQPMVTLGTDNQIIKLKDGSLLALRNVVNAEPVANKPAWWDKVVIQGVKNGRVGTMIWHSTDGAHWTRRGFIDPLDYEKGRYAVPRPSPQEDSPCGAGGCFGGWDRVEAYADPYTGDVYASMFATGGYLVNYDKNVRPIEQTAYTNIIFKSLDGGKTWKELTTIGGWTPLVMTSTPNGRLYVFSCQGSDPKLWYTQKNNGVDVVFSADNLVGLNNIPCGGDDLYGKLVYKATNSISRVSTDATSSKVRISYPFVGPNGHGALAVANVEIKDGAAQPIVQAHGLIKGNGNTSILASQFIDGDAEGIKVAPGVAALYWIEASGTGNNDGQMQVRAKVFRGDKEMTPEINVSKVSTPAVSVGHYMGGGSFVQVGQIKFLAQWAASDGIWANVIATNDHPITGAARKQ